MTWSLEQCQRLHEDQYARTIRDAEGIAERACAKAVRETLLTIGVDVSNPLDAQRDFAVIRQVGRIAMDSEFRKDLEHARAWRLAMAEKDGVMSDLEYLHKRKRAAEMIGWKGIGAAIAVLVPAALGAFWLGIQQLLSRGH